MKTRSHSKSMAERIIIWGMVTTALIAGLTAMNVYWVSVSCDKKAEEASSSLGKSLQQLKRECYDQDRQPYDQDRSCRNAKGLIESLSEDQLNYLVGNFLYGRFVTDRRSKILVRKVDREWWCCSKWRRKPTSNVDERYIYRVSSSGQTLPTIKGICTGREYTYFAGERLYSGSIIRKPAPDFNNCEFAEPYYIIIGSAQHLRNIEIGDKYHP